MPRGKRAKDGDTNVAKNGYHYTRVDNNWRLTHHIVAEQILGRRVDTATEVVRFKDGDKTNLSLDNIEVIPKYKASVRKRLAQVEARIAELEGTASYLKLELGLTKIDLEIDLNRLR